MVRQGDWLPPNSAPDQHQPRATRAHDRDTAQSFLLTSVQENEETDWE